MFEEKDVFSQQVYWIGMLGVLERIMRTSKEIIVLEKMTGEMILEFCTTKNMGLDNTLFKKRESNQVLCESEPSKMKLLLGLERSNKVCERH